jgi:hypothetical protein
MTAIATIYTEEGFVIAADGRKHNPENHAILGDKTQKIFELNHIDGPLAICFAGTAAIDDDDHKTLLCDICQASLDSAARLARRRTRDLEGLAVRICRPVNQALADIQKSGRISKYPEDEPIAPGERGNTITRVWLHGYHRGISRRVGVRFFHIDQGLQEPEVRSFDLAPSRPWICGSPSMLDIFRNYSDPRFSEYRPIRGDPKSLAFAIEWSAGFIRACSDRRALEIDPNCYAVGGHIHIATITPREGFRWVPQYEPIAADVSLKE